MRCRRGVVHATYASETPSVNVVGVARNERHERYWTETRHQDVHSPMVMDLDHWASQQSAKAATLEAMVD